MSTWSTASGAQAAATLAAAAAAAAAEPESFLRSDGRVIRHDGRGDGPVSTSPTHGGGGTSATVSPRAAAVAEAQRNMRVLQREVREFSREVERAPSPPSSATASHHHHHHHH
eukprot:Rhum_TRINITY_DN14828_c33_g1::Rhum_TRINITY_DN14828_c33_g1_i1::g.124064::m.124064